MRLRFGVTSDADARLFTAVAYPMPADPDHLSHQEDPLERTELVRRLRRMEWPSAPPEVKDRVLRRIVGGHEQDADGDGADSPPDRSS